MERIKMNTSIRVVVITLLVAVIGVGGYFAWQNFYGAETLPLGSTESSQQVVEQEIEGVGRTEISYTATEGITSLEQLQAEVEDVVIVEHSEFGSYVDSIEGNVGGEDGYYWSFYVDGQMAEVGADSYMQKGGEVIECKYQSL